MDDATVHQRPGGGLSRRELLVAGGVGAAALWLGPEWNVVDGVAEAATRNAELRRSGWVQVTDPLVRASFEGRTVSLRLEGVSDLPIADQLPAMRDHDAAFAVRFSGPPGLEQGPWTLDHSELGRFTLFGVPVERERDGRQSYMAIVDRTVRIAGVNDEPVPEPDQIVVADARAALPYATTALLSAAPSKVVSRRTLRATPRRSQGRGALPRVRRLAARRSSTRRTVLAEMTWQNARSVAAVHGLLMSRGRVVARAGGPVRRLSRLRMRLRPTGRRTVPRGRYELRLTVVDRRGHVTRIRRTVRIG